MPGHTMVCTECSRAVAPAACVFCSGTKIARNLDTSGDQVTRGKRKDKA